uniref:Uncharacterized protein n=1 Tax=Brassica campestris TaxID=3711 RepID=M4D107_BRACM
MSLLSSSVRVNPSSSKVTSSTTLMLLSSATRTATGIFFASGSSLRCWSSWKPISFASDKEEAPNSCSSYSQRRHINVKRLTSSKLDWQRTTKLLHGAIAVVIRDERTSSRHGEEHLRN